MPQQSYVIINMVIISYYVVYQIFIFLILYDQNLITAAIIQHLIFTLQEMIVDV